MDDKAVLKIVYPRNTTTEEQTKRQEHTKNRNKKGSTQFKIYSFNIFSAGETMRKYNTQ